MADKHWYYVNGQGERDNVNLGFYTEDEARSMEDRSDPKVMLVRLTEEQTMAGEKKFWPDGSIRDEHGSHVVLPADIYHYLKQSPYGPPRKRKS